MGDEVGCRPAVRAAGEHRGPERGAGARALVGARRRPPGRRRPRRSGTQVDGPEEQVERSRPPPAARRTHGQRAPGCSTRTFTGGTSVMCGATRSSAGSPNARRRPSTSPADGRRHAAGRHRCAHGASARLATTGSNGRPAAPSPVGHHGRDEDRPYRIKPGEPVRAARPSGRRHRRLRRQQGRAPWRAPTSRPTKLFDLQQLLYADSTPQGAGGAAGHGHLGQGRHHQARVQDDQPARRPGGQLQAPQRRRARARLPLAGAPQHAPQRRDHDLQPQPLRGRARGAGARPRPREGVAPALRPHPRLRADARRRGHGDPQVLPAHLQGRAARAPPGAARQPGRSTGSSSTATSRSASTGTTTPRPTRRPSAARRPTTRPGT